MLEVVHPAVGILEVGDLVRVLGAYRRGDATSARAAIASDGHVRAAGHCAASGDDPAIRAAPGVVPGAGDGERTVGRAVQTGGAPGLAIPVMRFLLAVAVDLGLLDDGVLCFPSSLAPTIQQHVERLGLGAPAAP